ncbi:hypothetical protein QK290_17945 [Pseudarthrobacter sp. AL07]|uniref:hypothetical protein n=1 Tax=unclassified Pseudarthrobacter TaxID=2647000 RepID=UPI002499E0F4|nr:MULTISPECIES: hypothetical protein [unclassified Pseudarthrobacter]MDI3196274.1 hypothetical protein [Pseudarthrobacter sp. AL20]MDI3210338.1 hypothetical protein [Pseudarthrobacter sp. AL07]
MTLTKIRTAAASSLAAAGLLFTLAACSTPTASQPTTSAPATTATSSSAASEPCTGVKVIVDSGALKQDAADLSVCVPVDAPTPASKVLDEANVKTVGTAQYPTELVCRVNGVPAADLDIVHKAGTYKEECKGMPAAFAYWSLWTKPASGDWAYAQEGLATLQVSPGQSLELLFTVDGEPAAPAA